MNSIPQPPPTSSAPVTVTDRVRRSFRWFIDPITTILMKTGITPNTLTVMGALVNGGVGVLAATGNLTLAGIVLLVSGLFDALDGALARRIGITSKFGAFLDSTLDRYSEAFVLGGVLVYAQGRGLALEELLAYVTLAGALLISYTRARAEGLGIDCKVGLLTRMERFLILSGLLIVQQLTIGLLILAILTHVTVIQRVLHVGRTLRRIERAEKE